MTRQKQSIPELIGTSLREPRMAASYVIGLELPTGLLWQAVILVSVLDVMVGNLTLRLLGGFGELPAEAQVDPMQTMLWLTMKRFYDSPLLALISQLSAVAVGLFALLWVGRAFGGRGDLGGALSVIAWFGFLFWISMTAVGLVGLVLPLAGLLQIVMLGVLAWVFTQFVMALHGFTQGGMVFAMILVTAFGCLFIVAMVMSILMVILFGGMPNV